MGAKLEAYFGAAEALGGVKAKVKLAMLTKLSAKAAATAPDSPESIAAMEAAMAQLKAEFG